MTEHVSAETTSLPSIYARIQTILGLSEIHSEADLAAAVDKKLPVRSVKLLVQSGLSDNEVYQIVVPRRTLAHRVAKHQTLSRDESDRAVRLARITSLAEKVFGDREAALRWLRKSKRRFNGRRPLDMLATETGAHLVEEMLYQIDDGMAA